MYEAAVATLSALNANWVEEVRSFRQPPQPVQFLGCALCLLFKKPQSYAFVLQYMYTLLYETFNHIFDVLYICTSTVRLILMRKGQLMLSLTFYEDLVFFDKDNVSDAVYEELQKKYIKRAEFRKEKYVPVSVAAASLVDWVHAVFNYATVYRVMRPHIERVIAHERAIAAEQETLGRFRLEAERCRRALESLLERQSQIMHAARDAERQLAQMKRKLGTLETLLEASAPHRSQWAKAKARVEAQSTNLLGVSLFGSALTVYAAPLGGHLRQLLFAALRRVLAQSGVLPASWFELVDASGEGDEVRVYLFS